jgi:polyhydroxybutyrate depolymerase
MTRTRLIVTIAVLVSLPLLFTLFEAVSFHRHNRDTGTIVSGGMKRGYVLYVPPTYDASKPTPLVISMHGAGGWGKLQEELSEWNRVADREGFIVVYPSGRTGGGVGVWGVNQGPGLIKDVRFIGDLIDKIATTYNIDRDRVYANGLSNGGGMTFVLSCTMSDRIAAFGMVGSAQTLDWGWCKDRRPVPMVNFHGTADTAAPYNGGESWVGPVVFPAVETWTSNWARRNRCRTTPVETVVAADVVRREYTNCADNAAVVLYTITNGGHTWPGGGDLPEWFLGRTTRSIDASSAMWEFFKKHPRNSKGPSPRLRVSA